MSTCLIAGGGLAGLAAAVHLTKNGIPVTLLESSPKLGGRAYSFNDPRFPDPLDNGQHILMGCYHNTISFLRDINAIDNIIIPRTLKMSLVSAHGEQFTLDASHGFYPLNQLFAILSYKALSLPDRIKVAAFMGMAPLLNPLADETISEWFGRWNQNEAIMSAIWDFLAIGAMNTSPAKADARMFKIILKEVFFSGSRNASILLPKYDLSASIIKPAEEYIKSKGGKIETGKQVTGIISENGVVQGLETAEGPGLYADYIILALPPHALQKLKGIENVLDTGNLNTEYSSILTFHIKTRAPQLTEAFYGLIGSPLHWVFKHEHHITTVMSDADKWIQMPEEKLFWMVAEELRKYLGIKRDQLFDVQMVKEKRATFVPSPSNNIRRPAPAALLKNLFLAGDWIQTGLPATIEGAIKSGVTAASLIQSN